MAGGMRWWGMCWGRRLPSCKNQREGSAAKIDAGSSDALASYARTRRTILVRDAHRHRYHHRHDARRRHCHRRYRGYHYHPRLYRHSLVHL